MVVVVVVVPSVVVVAAGSGVGAHAAATRVPAMSAAPKRMVVGPRIAVRLTDKGQTSGRVRIQVRPLALSVNGFAATASLCWWFGEVGERWAQGMQARTFLPITGNCTSFYIRGSSGFTQ